MTAPKPTDSMQQGISKNAKHAYRIYSNPAGVSRYHQFINENFIALGWSKLGDVSLLSEAELRVKVSDIYQKKGQSLGLIIGYFRRILAMRPGELIVLPDHKNRVVTIAEITGTYRYEPRLVSEDCAHTVAIRQLRVVEESALPEKMLKSIQTRTSLITLDAYLDELIQLANGGSASMNINTAEYVERTTLVEGKKILLRYPKGVTRQQLLDFVSQLDIR